MSPREVAQPRPRHLLWLAGAIVFTALNLRTAVASVPPLLDELRADVPLSATAAGALTTLPVICMATGASIAPRVARRIGTEAAVAALALTMAAGMLLRLLPGAAALFAGTTVAGLGIALGNVLVPSLIKRDFPERQVGAMTGGYTMAISASGAVAAALTVPAEEAIGSGWRPALAVWAVPALVVAVIWLPQIARATPADRAAPLPSLWPWMNEQGVCSWATVGPAASVCWTQRVAPCNGTSTSARFHGLSLWTRRRAVPL